MGPEPSTRIDLMSVRFGIGRGVYGKRAAARPGHFGPPPRLFARNASWAVARARLDADQNRRIAGLSLLERRRVLEGVRRNDAVIVIGGRDEDGRIGEAFPDVVERGVRI